ncbi:MAG: DUF6932 family protein [Acidimicrobiales bacterium]
MLPPLGPETGLLPAGEHAATWDEVVERFGWNERRRRLLDGLADALELLGAAGCRQVWLNGSFVTAKDEPGDFDACWDTDDVDLDQVDPVICPLVGPPRSAASAASSSRTSPRPAAASCSRSSSRTNETAPTRGSSC